MNPPAEMTWRELADEIDQAKERGAGPWPEQEWDRFIAVTDEFVRRIRLGTTMQEAKPAHRPEWWRVFFAMTLALGFAVACMLLPLVLVEGR